MQLQPRDALPKIMLARYYSAALGRFITVDPVEHVKAMMPAPWNAFAYTGNSPLLFVDPSGLLRLAFDFSKSSLPVKTQARIIAETRAKFERAGVKDVTAGQEKFSSAIKAKKGGEDVVPILVQDKALHTWLPGFKRVEVVGTTDLNLTQSKVSTARAPKGKEVTFTANVAGHEAGHETLGEIDPHSTAEPGSLMERVPTEKADTLGEKPRDFDSSDSKDLKEHH